MPFGSVSAIFRTMNITLTPEQEKLVTGREFVSAC